jgi:hypothetical protein
MGQWNAGRLNRTLLYLPTFRPGELMNTVAHEMWHRRGYADRPNGYSRYYKGKGAYFVGTYCRGDV